MPYRRYRGGTDVSRDPTPPMIAPRMKMAIIRAATSPGSDLGITITADGVACKAELDKPRTEDCAQAQRSHFSHSMRRREILPTPWR